MDSIRCFVIMPFSKTSEKHTEEYWTHHFDAFLDGFLAKKVAGFWEEDIWEEETDYIPKAFPPRFP